MRGIQKHLLEIPTQEELRAQRDRADVAEAERILAAPTLSVSVDSPEEGFGETIEIGVDVTHHLTVTLAIFLASTVVMRLAQNEEAMHGIQEHLLDMATQEELRAMRDRADVAEIMAAPTVFVSVDSSKESFRETIKIGIDVTHYLPVTSAVFLASTVVMRLAKNGEAMRGIQEYLLEMPTQEELRALRDRADVVEAEGATLRATIRTMGVFKMSLHNRMRDKRHTHNEIERQLDLV
nr:hypothetical protein [Tanacetum cinerariifolium]